MQLLKKKENLWRELARIFYRFVFDLLSTRERTIVLEMFVAKGFPRFARD
jgi:hypothetical protein